MARFGGVMFKNRNASRRTMTRMTAISNWRTAEGEAERARFESLSANAFCAASLQRLYTLARGCMEFPHPPTPPPVGGGSDVDVSESPSRCISLPRGFVIIDRAGRLDDSPLLVSYMRAVRPRIQFPSSS
jgi:hypothetical protein